MSGQVLDRLALDPIEALGAWALPEPVTTPIVAGHINRTWRVDTGGRRLILQWLNPLFGPELHHDIEAITAHVEAAGLVTPRLVRTRDGALWHASEAGTFRVFTFIDGAMVLTADSPTRCLEAGRLLGRFHAALWDLDHTFRFTRLSVHDTPRHLANLERALVEHRAHHAFPRVEPVAHAILGLARGLELGLDLPRRIVHGDPKISNVLFAPDGTGRCLVDLDTLARMPIAVELGDAFRSWCSPAGEEVEAACDATYFAAGLSGYAQGLGPLATAAERSPVVALTATIATELAARFCADALNESYFGWDCTRFPSASAHNITRARSQLALARSILAQRAALEKAAIDAWRV